MEILPLNYDKYFKKVFSDTEIAKKFLEDFLDIKIAEIKLLEKDINLTNKARKIRFDFRCKGDDKHFIVEMQHHINDVVKRFYLYHSTNTSLQLENLPLAERTVLDRKTQKYHIKKIRDYSKVTPSISIIWFVDDSFRSDEDFLVFTVLPEKVKDFINDKKWGNLNEENLEKIIKKHDILKKLIRNRHRELDFLQENKMIYIFQKQVIKNNNEEKYFKWFDFADKSKKKDNKISDFPNYEEKVFKKLMHILSSKFVPEGELNEVENYFLAHEMLSSETNDFVQKRTDELRSELLEGLKKKDEIIEIKDEIIEKNNEIIEKNNGIIEKNNGIIEENKKRLKEKDNKLKKKDLKIKEIKYNKDLKIKEINKKLENEILNIARIMKKNGINIKEIKKLTKLSLMKINKL